MINNMVYEYNEIIHNIDKLDKAGNQLLCICDFEQHTSSELIELMNKTEKAEISLLFGDGSTFPNDVYAYCCLNAVIIYIEIGQLELLDLTNGREDLDFVLLIDFVSLEELDHIALMKIIEKNCHICVVSAYGSLQKVNNTYSKLLNKGFSGIFSFAYMSHERRHPRECKGLIDRKMLMEFKIEQNISIKEQIDILKKNSLHRHNRMMSKKDNRHLQIVLVNINVDLQNNSRKNLGTIINLFTDMFYRYAVS